MRLKILKMLTLVTLLLGLSVWSAEAGGQHGVHVLPAPGAFIATSTTRLEGDQDHHVSPAGPAMPPGEWITTNFCALGGNVLCAAFDVCPDGSLRVDRWYQADNGAQLDESLYCPVTSATSAPPSLTPGRVLEAFRRLPLPESPLSIQPSGGETIVNFDTIFYTTRRPFGRSVRLLGHRVSFVISPVRFTWVWGDGDREVTSRPGRPFRRGVPVDRDITHRYLSRDRFQPRLDTTYGATYSVDGGPARPVGGTVTIVGTPQELVTVTYTPLLVDD